MKSEQKKFYSNCSNSETSQKGYRPYGWLPPPLWLACGHFENDRAQYRVWKNSRAVSRQHRNLFFSIQGWCLKDRRWLKSVPQVCGTDVTILLPGRL